MLCARLRNLAIEHAASASGVVTLSVGGISIVSCDILRSIDELYVRADQALYRAKASGRDCVVMASDRQEAGPEVDLDLEACQQDV